MSLYSDRDDLPVQESDYPYSPMLAIGLLFWVLIVYLALRQAGQALGMLLAGGGRAGVDLLLISTQELVKSSGALSGLQVSLRSLGGMLLPIAAWAIFMLLAARRGTSPLEALKLVSSIGVLGSLVGWVLVPLGYTPGQTVPSEDVTLFLHASGWNGIITAGLCLLLLIGAYLLARNRIGYLGALRDLLQGKADDLDYPSNRRFYLGISAVLALAIAASLILRLLRG